ncbi:MAG: hypothetical protein ABJ327_04580 [Litoreibacter sp.]
MKRPDSQEKEIDLGVYQRTGTGVGAADMIAIVLTLIWLAGVTAYFLVLPSEGASTQSHIVTAAAILLPIMVVWISTTMAKAVRDMRSEAAQLQSSVDAMRQAYLNQTQTLGIEPTVEKKLDEIAASQKQTQAAVATFATSRTAPVPTSNDQPALTQPGVAEGDSQPALALGTPNDALVAPLSVDDFIGALNFPEDENDSVGFGQLRRALADRESGRLVRASQDVLTLLSQEGIYMDDLTPDRAKPSVWRKFAEGERGPGISDLGGIHDRAALALTAGRMRSDPVFRDAVHHFLRQYDRTLVAFVDIASDTDIIRLSVTRTSCAFMLLGRVTGTFD